MAAPQNLGGEHSLQLPSVHRAPLVSAAGSRPHLSRRSASLHLDSLLPKQRRAQKAAAASGVLAVILASLAVVYLMLICMRQVSGAARAMRESHRLRLLAGSSPDDDRESCLASTLAEVEEEEQGEEEEGAGDQAGALAPADAQAASPANWRHVPPEVESQIIEALEMLAEPLVVLRRLLPVLRPSHAMSVSWVVGRLLCLELSAFALAPHSLEPLKTEVAHAYVKFVNELLTTTSDFARQAELQFWQAELTVTQVMIGKIAGPPSVPQRLAPDTYTSFMIVQQQLCRLQYCLILQVLETAEALKVADPSPASDDRVFFQLHALNELYQTRLSQVLSRATSRFWISHHQATTFPNYFFDPHIEQAARQAQQGTVRAQRRALVAAAEKYYQFSGFQLARSQASALGSSEQQELHEQQQQMSEEAGLHGPQLSGDTETVKTQSFEAAQGEQLQTSVYQHYSASAFLGLTEQGTGVPAATPVPSSSSSEKHISWMYQREVPFLQAGSSRSRAAQSWFAAPPAPPDDGTVPESQFSWIYEAEMTFSEVGSSQSRLARGWFASTAPSPDDATASPASAAAKAGGQAPSASGVSEGSKAAGRTEQQLTTDSGGAAGADLGEEAELLGLIEDTLSIGSFSEDQQIGDD
ncbi:hypothetical protein ACSSS7_007805 [Eimeria intestinalis]